MDFYLHLLIIALTVVSTTNCASINRNSGVLQPQIKSLLDELASPENRDVILYWNTVALRTCANDFDPMVAATPDQPSPTKVARAFAIIHGAMYEAMAAFNPVYQPMYKMKQMPDRKNVQKQSAVDAAVAEAAYRTLFSLYPQQRSIFDAIRTKYFNQLDNKANKKASIITGTLVGKIVAEFILLLRAKDGSQVNVNYTPIPLPGYHQPDPTHPNQGFADPQWGNVTPFFMTSGSQFSVSNNIGATPEDRAAYLNSIQYINDFNEVKAVGAKNSIIRTPDQTEIGLFWAYDGAPRIGVPLCLYNQIVRTIAIKKANTLEENAKLFALVNYAMGDAGIAAWNTKYSYNFWRPIIGIRLATGYTQPDPNWLPLGSPADNAGSTDFTPGFPSYVSGHSTFGSATFESLRQFYKTDKFNFQIQSDEFNGKTFDSNTGQIRPKKTRNFQSFTQAETENFLGRIYLGVHWRTDQEGGRTIGRQIAQFVYNKFR